MLRDRDLVCIAAVDWYGIRNRSQQLMTRFAHNNRVLYVNPPSSWLSPWRDKTVWQKRTRWKKGPIQVQPGLYVLDLPLVLPFASRIPRINAINQRIIAGMIRRAMAKLDFQDSILWTYLHTSADLYGRIGETLVCYDCVDEHGAFPGHHPGVVNEMESRLLQRADVVFASARELYERRRNQARDIHLVPNGADLAHFEKVQGEKLAAPVEMANIPRPVVGYIGFIHDWLDLDWIRYAAQKQPDWSFCLIGPVHTDTSTLSHLDNVHFFGEKDYEDLPAYLQHFSVCVIPFRRSALTDSVNPIKLYEYLAAGKPVAASRLPELEAFSDVVALADTAEEFYRALASEMQTDSPKKVQDRQERVRFHSWDHRFAEIERVLEDLIRERASS